MARKDPQPTDPQRRDLARAVLSTPKISHLAPIDQVRWVVEHKQAARVRGALLDLTSAGMILQVYERLSPTNKVRLESKPIPVMMAIVCEVLRKADIN